MVNEVLCPVLPLLFSSHCWSLHISFSLSIGEMFEALWGCAWFGGSDFDVPSMFLIVEAHGKVTFLLGIVVGLETLGVTTWSGSSNRLSPLVLVIVETLSEALFLLGIFVDFETLGVTFNTHSNGFSPVVVLLRGKTISELLFVLVKCVLHVMFSPFIGGMRVWMVMLLCPFLFKLIDLARPLS